MLILDFSRSYVDPNTGETVEDFIKVARNYLSGWFWIDFLSLIPLQLIDDKFFLIKLLRIFRFPEFLEFFDFALLHQYITSLSEDDSRTSQVETQFILKFMYKAFRLALITCVITYFLGLLMYIISDSLNSEDSTFTFIKVYELDLMSSYEVIVRCMYLMFATMTTVGFGDFAPKSNIERVYMIIVELFGGAFYSYIMGNFLEILSNYDKKLGENDREIELQHWINALDNYDPKTTLTAELIHEIERHFDYFWKEYRAEGITPDDSILNSLPKSSQDYVSLGF